MITFRPFEKNDAKTVLSWTTENSFFLWCADRFSGYPLSEDEFNNIYNDESYSGFVACENGENIGHLFMQRLTYDKIKFGLIIVDNTKRGQGLGKRMLENALVFAKEKYNPKSVVLSVFDENPSAAKCYISLGFAYNQNERTIFHEGKDYIYREMEYLM